MPFLNGSLGAVKNSILDNCISVFVVGGGGRSGFLLVVVFGGLVMANGVSSLNDSISDIAFGCDSRTPCAIVFGKRR